MKRILLFAFSLALAAGVSAQTYYLDEDFESGLPTGWTQSTLATDGGWNVGTAAALSSSSLPIPTHTTIIATNDDGCNCDKSADSLFTDTIDLTMASGLLVMKYDVYYSELTYSGATESLDFFIYSENAGSWSLLSDLGPNAVTFDWEDGHLLDLSAYAGDQVVIAFVYNDGGGWTYGAALDNISIYEAGQYDVANLSVDNGIYQEVNTSTNILGTIRNMGSETITDLEMSYSVDGGSSVSAIITGLNIAPLSDYAYTHPTAWTPTVEQLSTVVTEVVSINGNPDGNSGNDVASLDILVHPTAVPRKPLLEQFTSSTCPPCTPGNENVLAVMSNYPGEYSKVNYQMSWPGSGDPYYTDEGGVRQAYYGVNSVPSMHTDGSAGLNSNSYTQGIFEGYQDVPAFVNLEVVGTIQPTVTYEVIGGQLIASETEYVFTATTNISPVIDLPAGLIAHISLQEDLTFNNVKTNGETEFHDVMKKMLPSANGTTLPAIVANDTFSITETHTFNDNYRLSNNAGDPINHSIEHSIEEWDDLRLATWVQTSGTAMVWQSENAQVALLELTDNLDTEVNEDGDTIYIVDGNPYEMFGGSIVPQGTEDIFGATVSVFPNPANSVLNIAGVSSNATVSIFDATGRMVRSQAISNNGVQVSDLDAGVYNIVIEDNGQQTTKRVSILH